MNILPGFEAHLGILPEIQPDGSAVQHSSKLNRPGRPDPNPTLPRRGFHPTAAPLPRGRAGRAAGAQPWTPPARPRHRPPAGGGRERRHVTRAVATPRGGSSAAAGGGGTAQRSAAPGRRPHHGGARAAEGSGARCRGRCCSRASRSWRRSSPSWTTGASACSPGSTTSRRCGGPGGEVGGRNRPGAIAALPPHRAPAGPALRLTACGSAGRAAA